MGSKAKKIWNAFTTVLVALVVVLAILLAGVRLFGLQVYTVLSGSMEPTYPVGSLIYVKKVDPASIEVGDAITFALSATTTATHRVIAITADEADPSALRFQTKGDANDAPDAGLVHEQNVLGKPVFSIPLLGYAAAYIQSPPGSYVAIAVGVILLLLVFLPDVLSRGSKSKGEPRGE